MDFLSKFFYVGLLKVTVKTSETPFFEKIWEKFYECFNFKINKNQVQKIKFYDSVSSHENSKFEAKIIVTEYSFLFSL